MSFLTLEDVNTALYSNQGFWWHCIDLSSFDGGDAFTDVKVDFCTISRETYSTDEFEDYYFFTPPEVLDYSEKELTYYVVIRKVVDFFFPNINFIFK